MEFDTRFRRKYNHFRRAAQEGRDVRLKIMNEINLKQSVAADAAEAMARLEKRLLGTEHQDYFKRHHTRYSFLINVMLGIGATGRVLDVGASPGHVTAICAELGKDITAADLNPHEQFPARTGQRPMNLFKEMGLPIAAADAATGTLPFAGGSFGLVLFNETLEHLAGSPLPAIREMARVLAPGGMMLITTPNAASLRNRLNLLLGRNIYTPLRVAVNVAAYKCHNREYTLPEVVELVIMAGLEPVRASRHNVGRPISGKLKKIAHAAYYAVTWAWPPGRSLICVVAKKP